MNEYVYWCWSALVESTLPLNDWSPIIQNTVGWGFPHNVILPDISLFVEHVKFFGRSSLPHFVGPPESWVKRINATGNIECRKTWEKKSVIEN